MVFMLFWRGKYQGKCESVRNYILLGDSSKITHAPDWSKKEVLFLPSVGHPQVGVETTCDLSVHQLVI